MHLRVVKGLLWLVCTTHLLMGLAGISSPAIGLKIARVFYGAHLESTPAIIHLLRIIGAYMITVGLLAGLAAADPQKHRPVIFAICILLTIRVVQRLVHADEIQSTFGISEARIWIQSAYFAALSVALLYLMPKRA